MFDQASSVDRRVRTERGLLYAVLALWLAATLALWPSSLSFTDEVGYLGQARLLAQGRWTASASDPGVWATTPRGLVGKYPLALALLVTPLLSLAPRAVFISGLAALLLLVLCGARALQGWSRSPLWSLLWLAHPTFALVARTLMADVLFALFAFAAWLAARSGRALWMISSFALLTVIKPTGFIAAAALLLGEALRDRLLRQRPPGRAYAYAASGILLGAALQLGLNLLTTGSWRFGYQVDSAPGQRFFSFANIPQHLLDYGLALLAAPPLLLLGLLPLWRRRELGPLLLIVSLLAIMTSYFFVDRGHDWLESVVLAPRLILPAVSFLLLGYADGIAPWLERWPRALAPLAAAALFASLGVSVVHWRWQRPMAQARARAAAHLARAPGAPLALTETALEAGLLHDGPSVLFEPAQPVAPVLLCNTLPSSYRAEQQGLPCSFPGYQAVESVGSFVILRRAASPGLPR